MGNSRRGFLRFLGLAGSAAAASAALPAGSDVPQRAAAITDPSHLHPEGPADTVVTDWGHAYLPAGTVMLFVTGASWVGSDGSRFSQVERRVWTGTEFVPLDSPAGQQVVHSLQA